MIDIGKVIDTIMKYENWDEIATVSLALWGSIVSTLIYLNDRPKISVGMARGFTVPQMDNSIALSIRNSGRRPITVSNITFETDQKKDKKFLFPFPNQYWDYKLPMKLDENEEITQNIPYEIIKNTAEEEGVNVEYLIFKDSIGKEYKYKLSWRVWGDLKCNTKKNFIFKIIDLIKFL